MVIAGEHRNSSGLKSAGILGSYNNSAMLLSFSEPVLRLDENSTDKY